MPAHRNQPAPADRRVPPIPRRPGASRRRVDRGVPGSESQRSSGRADSEGHQKPWSPERPEVGDPSDDVVPLSEKQLQQIEGDYQQATDRIHAYYKATRNRILNNGGANAPAVSLATESVTVRPAIRT